jgi:hypothetical protein
VFRVILIAALALASPLHAQEKKPPTEAQQRLAGCNQQADAKALKGDGRKKFMSTCLKDKPQDRMAKCNVQASGKGLKGEPRKKFMSACLKG